MSQTEQLGRPTQAALQAPGPAAPEAVRPLPLNTSAPRWPLGSHLHLCACPGPSPGKALFPPPSVNSHTPFLDRKPHPRSPSHQCLAPGPPVAPQLTSFPGLVIVTVPLCPSLPGLVPLPGRPAPGSQPCPRQAVPPRMGPSGGCPTEVPPKAQLTRSPSPGAGEPGQGEGKPHSPLQSS